MRREKNVKLGNCEKCGKEILGSALRLLWKKATSSIKDTCATMLTKAKKKIASLRTSGRD